MLNKGSGNVGFEPTINFNTRFQDERYKPLSQLPLVTFNFFTLINGKNDSQLCV